jgi:hypothetical protein
MGTRHTVLRASASRPPNAATYQHTPSTRLPGNGLGAACANGRCRVPKPSLRRRSGGRCHPRPSRPLDVGLVQGLLHRVAQPSLVELVRSLRRATARVMRSYSIARASMLWMLSLSSWRMGSAAPPRTS